MQQFLYIILFSAFVAGCNDNSATTTRDSETAAKEKSAKNLQLNPGETGFDITNGGNVDTLGLAEFLAIKAARFRQSDREYDNISTDRKMKVDTSGWAAYKRMRAKTDRQLIEVPAPQEEITTDSKRPNTSRNSTTSKNETAAQQSVPEVENKSAEHPEVAGTPADQTTAKKDKHVSNKTKGAIIGAVTGAAAGAVINKKNRKAGGVVGGILGAATGYGIGRHKDKKDTAAKGGKQIPDNKQQF
jgi:hypothetical protein